MQTKTNLLLIHGFGTHINKTLDYCGFDAFQNQLNSGSAKTFIWGKFEMFRWYDYLNIFKYSKLFFHEKYLTKNHQILNNLQQHLLKNSINTIVTHSLGTMLLLEYLYQGLPLPVTLKNIYITQGCVDRTINLELINNNYKNQPPVKIVNLYCPYDNALLVNMLVLWQVTSGLFGFKNLKNQNKANQFLTISNKFWPLYRRFNLHRSTICDPNFATLVNNQI
jgi:hypothetical protein